MEVAVTFSKPAAFDIWIDFYNFTVFMTSFHAESPLSYTWTLLWTNIERTHLSFKCPVIVELM